MGTSERRRSWKFKKKIAYERKRGLLSFTNSPLERKILKCICRLYRAIQADKAAESHSVKPQVCCWVEMKRLDVVTQNSYMELVPV